MRARVLASCHQPSHTPALLTLTLAPCSALSQVKWLGLFQTHTSFLSREGFAAPYYWLMILFTLQVLFLSSTFVQQWSQEPKAVRM